MGAAIVPYADGVIDKKLPGGPRLEGDWALQNPRDYLDVVNRGIPRALKEAGVNAENIIGLGTDFTASTPLPARPRRHSVVLRQSALTPSARLGKAYWKHTTPPSRRPTASTLWAASVTKSSSASTAANTLPNGSSQSFCKSWKKRRKYTRPRIVFLKLRIGSSGSSPGWRREIVVPPDTRQCVDQRPGFSFTQLFSRPGSPAPWQSIIAEKIGETYYRARRFCGRPHGKPGRARPD